MKPLCKIATKIIFKNINFYGGHFEIQDGGHECNCASENITFQISYHIFNV